MRQVDTLRCASIFLALAVLPSRAEVVMPTLSWTPSNEKVSMSGDIATVALPGTSRQSGYIRTTFDMSAFAGKAFELTVNAKLEAIAGTMYSWEGLKFQFSFRDELRGKDNNIDGSIPQKTGTTDGWIPLKLRFDPSKYRTTTATLALGVQQAYGTARFDMSTLAIRETPAVCEPTNQDYIVSYPERVAEAAPFRGVMSPTDDMCEGDFRTLHSWGATVVRQQLANCPSEALTDIASYLKWVHKRLDTLEDTILPLAEKYGILVVLDLHNTIGGRVDGYADFALFEDDAYYETWIDLWREIATRFRGDRRIYGYDLCNEPNQTAGHKRNYWQIQQSAAEAIREIDPDVTIVMEANAADAPDAFYYLSPLSMDNVIYQVHMYEPGTYTHQGLDGNPVGQAYPGTLPNGNAFNKDWLYAQLAPVRAFQTNHNARILVGEFSAVCWAPDAEAYLKDLTDIYDEYGWDWCYMAFRAWGGWSFEHQERTSGEPTLWDFVPAPDNERKKAILTAIAEGAEPESVVDYLRLESGQSATLNNATNDNPSAIKRIVFAGGSMRGTSFDGRPLCTANGARWRLESENGAPILVGDIGLQRFHWHTGDGFVETRGDAEFVLYTTSYNDTYGRGTVWFDDARTAWDHTGNFVVSNAVKVICGADDCLPHGNDTGGIRLKWVNRHLPQPMLDLCGHTIAVNELLAGGGIVTNSSVSRATLRLGENDIGGMIAVQSLDCSGIDIEKTGSGQNGLDCGSSSFGNLRLESGSFLVRGAEEDIVELESIDVPSDATLIVEDTTLHARYYATNGVVALRGTGKILCDVLMVPEGRPMEVTEDASLGPIVLRDDLRLKAGTTTLQFATNANPDVASRILFEGGTLRGTSFNGTPLCSANGGKWILEGSSDAGIVIGELRLQRISWLTGDGSVETRGDCDVVVYENQYQSAGNLSGIVYFNTSNALWNHTGDLVISNGVRAICRADGCLPCGPQTGDVVLFRTNFLIPAPLLDLNGHSVSVNGIRTVGGGVVTNTSSAVASISIGEGDACGAITNISLTGGNISLVKLGSATNVLALAASDLASLRVEDGVLVVSGAESEVLNASSVSVAAGATLVLDGVSLESPEISGMDRIVSMGGGGFAFDVRRRAWFSAAAQGDRVADGRWIAKPQIDGARYLLEYGDALFSANAARRTYPRVDAHLTVTEAWLGSRVGVLAADAERAGARACLIPVKNDGDGQTWFGLVGDGAGRGVFVPLTGHDAACGDYCIAVEFCESSGASGPMQLVSYLVADSDDSSEFVRLSAESGATWFPANGSGRYIQGAVRVSGEGALFDLLGSAVFSGSHLILR